MHHAFEEVTQKKMARQLRWDVNSQALKSMAKLLTFRPLNSLCFEKRTNVSLVIWRPRLFSACLNSASTGTYPLILSIIYTVSSAQQAGKARPKASQDHAQWL